MNDDALEQVNRVLVVAGALAIACIALLAALVAWYAPNETIQRIPDFAGYLRRHNDRETKAIISLGAAVVILLMLTVIAIELTPSSTRKMRVRRMKSGFAVITTSEIARRIDSAVAHVPHVAACSAIVAARGQKVDVVLDLHVDAGANLSQTADEACRRAHVLVEEQLGIEMAAMPRARLHYRELRLGGEGAPAAPEQRTANAWDRPGAHEGELDQRG